MEEMEIFGYMYYMLNNKSDGYDTINFPYEQVAFGEFLPRLSEKG